MLRKTKFTQQPDNSMELINIIDPSVNREPSPEQKCDDEEEYFKEIIAWLSSKHGIKLSMFQFKIINDLKWVIYAASYKLFFTYGFDKSEMCLFLIDSLEEHG